MTFWKRRSDVSARRTMLQAVLLIFLLFADCGYAGELSKMQTVLRCMEDVSCKNYTYRVLFGGEVSGVIMHVSADKTTKDDILLTESWVAVRKTVQDDGDSVTLIFDYDMDGTIDAVRFSHEKSPMINTRQAENMSDEEKKSLQAYFNLVMIMAYILSVI